MDQPQNRKRRALLGAGLALALGLGTAGGVALAQDAPGPAPHSVVRHAPDKDKGPKRAKAGQVVVGAIGSIGPGSLKVARDGGGEVALTTDDATKVRGLQKLGDLRAGQRVSVRVKDGRALAVVLAKAHAKGTVTFANGARATLLTAGGLAQELDLTAVAEKPKVGDVVSVTGVAAEAGRVLRAERLRQLPK